MNQIELIQKAVAALDSLGIPYMLVGSYGSGAWGEARFTRDIDIVVDLPRDKVKPLVEAFPLPDYYVSEEAAMEAVAQGGQFNVIHPTSGIKIDFMIAGQDAWQRGQLERRRRVELAPGVTACVAAPEDVIISKMLYYREGGSEKHLRDITGILKISGEEVDRDYVAHWATELGLTPIWRAILERVGSIQSP